MHILQNIGFTGLAPGPPLLSADEVMNQWMNIPWTGRTLKSFPGGSDGKEPACNAGDPGSVPGLGKSPGEGNGNPLQYSYLENPMDRGVWQAIVGSLRVGHDWSNLAHMGGLKAEIYFLTVLETKSARSQRHRVCFWWGLSSWHVFLLCLHMAFA